MGDMRKGYVSERFMIVAKKDDKVVDPKKFPFAPGNESMTNPSVLSLVEKGGIVESVKRWRWGWGLVLPDNSTWSP